MPTTRHVPVYEPHASQFAYGLKGACTLLGLAACDVISKGMRAYVLDPHAPNPNPASIENVQAVMWRIYQQARAQHPNALCAANGGATQRNMLDMSRLIGLPIKDVLYLAEPQSQEVAINFLRRYVAHAPTPYPVLVQVANGASLVDVESGIHDEAGLQCHALCIYGTETDEAQPLAGGYICCDGDHSLINERSVIYSSATLAKAQIISAIAFDYVR